MTKKTEIPGVDEPVTAEEIGVTPEEIEKWKKTHGKVFAVKCGEQWFVFKKAGWPVVSRFIDTVSKSLSEANLTLVLDSLVWPSAEAFGQAMQENPMLPVLLGNKVQDQYGIEAVGDVKNL